MENAFTLIKNQLESESLVYDYLALRWSNFIAEFNAGSLLEKIAFLGSTSSLRLYKLSVPSLKMLIFTKRDQKWTASASTDLTAMLLALEGDAIALKRISALIILLAAYQDKHICPTWLQSQLEKGPSNVHSLMATLHKKGVLRVSETPLAPLLR